MWINMHGDSKLSYHLKVLGMPSWSDFKKMAGYKDHDNLRDRSRETAKEEFLAIIKKHKEKSLSSYWLRKNGYSGLHQWSLRNFGSWENFLEYCGYKKLTNASRAKESAKKEFFEIKNKQGDKVLSTMWLTSHGYSGLVRWVTKQFGSWENFLKYVQEEK